MKQVLELSLVSLFLLCICSTPQAAPLHDAAKQGDLALIAKLIDEGADVNKRSAIATPLYFAVQEKHIEAVELLIKRGANVNGESVGGTALQLAAKEGLTDFVRILLENGANPNATFRRGVNALHFASEKGHLEVVRLLLSHGANVKAVDMFGYPAIHFAMIDNHTDVAQLLVENGSKAPAIEPVNDKVSTANIAHGNELTIKCRGCHTMEKEGHTKVGPPLWNVLDRPKASIPEYEYSIALKTAGGKWTYEALNSFIAYPGWAIPGTAMTIEAVATASDRADIIAYIRTLSDSPVPLP